LQRGELNGENYSGSASVLPTLPGRYTYALTCGGVESGSAALTVTGSAQPSTTTTLVASSQNLTQGQSATFAANIGYTPNQQTHAAPTGTVTFRNGGEILGQIAVNANGAANLTASTVGETAGNYLYSASYSGDANFAPSNSTDVNVKLLAQTAAVLSATPASAAAGSTVTLLAAVQEQNASQLPTGTVTFYLGKRLLGRSSLIDGQTTWVQSTQGLAAGSYIVSAVYAGDAADAASTAAPIVVTVTP